MQSDGNLTFGDLYRMVFGQWKVIAVLTFLGALIAAVIAYFSPPVYRAQVLMSPLSPETGGSSLSRLAEKFAPLTGIGGMLGDNGGFGNKDVWIATLKSRQLTEAFINTHDLKPLLFPDRWDAAAKAWKVKNGKPQEPTLEEAFDRFDTSVRNVSEERRTGLVTLSIDLHDRRLVAPWANDLVALANNSIRERVIDEARRSIGFLEAELTKTNVVERQQIIYRLVETKVGDIMMANSRKDYAFAVVDPAVEPSAANRIAPRRTLMTGIGGLLGMLAGLAYAAIAWSRRQSRASNSTSV
jgi:uncharacterized protein involved in exopolysaccharide biosynthesis